MVMWTVDITGAEGNTAKLTKATITVTSTKSTMSIVQDFDVTNPTVTLVDGAGSADQRKPIKTILPNLACSTMCGDGTFELDLVYDVDGQSIPVSSSGDFTCAVQMHAHVDAKVLPDAPRRLGRLGLEQTVAAEAPIVALAGSADPPCL